MRSGVLSLVALSAVIMLVTLSITGTGGSAPVATAAGSTAALFFDKVNSGTSADVLQAISGRSVLVFGPNAKQVPIMRGANPSLKILMYDRPPATNTNASDYRYLDNRETWWVHDAKGSRMHEAGGQGREGWLLHIGNSDYRLYEQAKIVKTVTNYAYDGVFLDVSIPYYVQYREWLDKNDLPTTAPASIVAGWPDWIGSFHQELHPLLADRLHIFNSWPPVPGRYEEYEAWFDAVVGIVDGAQMDGFCYNRSEAWSLDKWTYQMQVAKRLIAASKVTLLKAPMDNLGGNLPKLHSAQRYCFGSYLLVADGRYALFRNPDEADNTYWNDRLFMAAIGTPLGPYFAVGPVFRRDFTNGAVVVNPSSSAYTIELGEEFSRLNGSSRASVTVNPQDGVILLRDLP